MDLSAFLDVGVAGLCITVLTVFVNFSRKEGTRDQRLKTVEEEQEKDREKIRDLYASFNSHDKAIGVLESNIMTVKETTERIENKLDRIYEAKNES